MVIRSAVTAAKRNPRAIVGAAMLSMAVAIGAALLFGSSASASCHNTGYGQRVCTPTKKKEKPFLKVKPKTEAPGKSITAYGYTGKGCPAHTTVEIYSEAFAGVARPGVGNVPTVLAKTDGKHNFSKQVRLGRTLAAKKYVVSGRCGRRSVRLRQADRLLPGPRALASRARRIRSPRMPFVAMITGASSGIGEATARRLARGRAPS